MLTVPSCSEPGWKLSGTVTDTGRATVAGVTVKLFCPEPSDIGEKIGKTGNLGEYVISGTGTGFPEDCRLEVSKPAYDTEQTTVRGVCTEKHKISGMCMRAEMNVTLRALQ